jgi:ketopantoate reductase
MEFCKTGTTDCPHSLRSLKIAVVGAGAIGSVIGGRLTEAGASVHLVDGWKEHVEAIQSEGLSLEKPNRTSTIPVKAVHVSELGTLESIDIVLLAVKSYDTLPYVLSKPIWIEMPLWSHARMG